MKVRALIRFKDSKENVIREIGDEFVVSGSRYDEMKKAGRFVEAVEEPKEEKKEEPKEESKEEKKEKPKEEKKETPKKKTSK